MILSHLDGTVGIAFQRNSDDLTVIPPSEDRTKPNPQKRKRKRTYDPTGLFIEPYRKKLKISEELSSVEEVQSVEETSGNLLEKSRKIDIRWALNVMFNKNKETPMWTGWNSKKKETLERRKIHQSVWYLPQINESPTSHSVVVETMKRSLRMADEANRESITVTYDFAIAKIALHIQAEERPTFDRLFISLGSFHIEMAFFAALGKVITESGGPHLLSECDILAKGSLQSFLAGTHYNRCKRLHEILSLAMEILHFQLFMTTLTADQLEICKSAGELHENYVKANQDINEIINCYHTFSDKTRSGIHGKTAEFWIKYIDIMHLYHAFSRSRQIGDFELFLSCFPDLTSYFFALNHHNYVRWMVRYFHNLVKLPSTHQEVYTEFKDGLFSVHRTKKSFSGSPIDLTLEQSINADAANQKKGITSITNSIGARQRWAESHSLRTALLTQMFSKLGMNKKEDVSRDLKPYKIKKDNIGVNKILDLVGETMNPFDSTIEKKHLYNTATGKSVKKETLEFLLSIKETGNQIRESFTKECRDDPKRFEQPINRRKLITFRTENGKKISSKDGKLVAACMVRDIFGSVLRLSLENSIGMAEVLRYPLTPLPLSISHVDGTMLKAPKSTLLKYLEAKVKSDPPTSIDVTIIDAMFFMHLQVNLPDTFGGVAKYLLTSLMKFDGKEIHFVTEKWVSPSIKDCERDNRGSSTMSYQINGIGQKRPANWLQALQNPSFKKSLIEF